MPSSENSDITLDGASILITGGTGSFGKTFLRTVLDRHAPRRVVIFSRDELKQYELEQTLSADDRGRVRFFIGDVRDPARLEMAMRGVEIVVHAAALKHVPAAEYNPFECVKTNIHGAENVVTGALRAGVRRVIALSTDKAANPINLYGATKLASDKIFVAANNLAGAQETRFSVVRYGNVLGSRGSVVPFFKRLLRDGAKTLPITHPEMTRFIITLDQGVQFVIAAIENMAGGEIFVPKLPSMRVVDLVAALGQDLACEIVGVRPGEKLHELMITREDSMYTVDIGDHYIIQPAFHWWNTDKLEASTAKHGTKLSEPFEYSSDSNDHWIAISELRTLMEQVF
jgi:UDP-N-acetylglucosamine 4,6-dehydratase